MANPYFENFKHLQNPGNLSPTKPSNTKNHSRKEYRSSYERKLPKKVNVPKRKFVKSIKNEKIIKTLLFTIYSVVFASPILGRLPFSCFPVRSLLFTPVSLICTPKSLTNIFPCVVPHARYVNGVGSPGWRGGVPDLICIFTRAYGLTCQPDSQLWIPVRLPFPQGTGESGSMDHT